MPENRTDRLLLFIAWFLIASLYGWWFGVSMANRLSQPEPAMDSILEECREAMVMELLQLGDSVIHDSNSIYIDGQTKQVVITNHDRELVATGKFLESASGCFYVLVDSR